MIKKDNSCQGKIAYASKELANVTAAHLNSLGGRRLSSYKCSMCKRGYHLGHNAKGKGMQPHDKQNKKKNKIDYIHEPGVHKIKDQFDD